MARSAERVNPRKLVIVYASICVAFIHVILWTFKGSNNTKITQNPRAIVPNMEKIFVEWEKELWQSVYLCMNLHKNMHFMYSRVRVRQLHKKIQNTVYTPTRHGVFNTL